MAKLGAQYPCFKPDDAGKGVVIGNLVTANLTVTLASGEIFGDDRMIEQLSVFSSGSLAMETVDMLDEVAAVVYGCTIEDGRVKYNINDSAPRGALAYYKVLNRDGVPFYQGFYYPRVRAALGNDNAQTRGNSITFQTTSTTFTIFADDEGDWRETETFDTIEEAKKWVNKMCGIEQEEPEDPEDP